MRRLTGRAEHVVFWLLAASGALALGAVYFACWRIALTQVFSIEYEGHVFWAACRLAELANIYDPERLVSEPWEVIIYNPVFPLAGAAMVAAFGKALWTLRLVSITATAATFIALYRLLKESGCRARHAVLTVAYFAGFLPVLYWSCLARVDNLGLALAAWSCERFYHAWKTSGGKPALLKLLPALALLVLAFYTKQQYFVFGIAYVVFLLWNAQAKLAGKFFALGLCAFATVAAILQVSTGGYLQHLSFAGRLPWEERTLLYHLQIIAADPKTAGAFLVVLAAVLANGSIEKSSRLPASLMLVALPLLLYTMGLRGAYHNHLLSSTFALCLWMGFGLRHIKPVILWLPLMALLAGLPVVDRVLLKLKLESQRACASHAWLQTAKRPELEGAFLLSEDPTFAVLLGARPAVVDATTFMNVWRNHPAMLAPLVDGIRAGKYPLVIINDYDSEVDGESIWPPEVVAAIKSRYTAAGKVFGNGNAQQVYVPR